MKVKKLFAAIICFILTLCVFVGGCDIFKNRTNDPDNSGDTSIEQPDDDTDKDQDKDTDKTTYSVSYQRGASDATGTIPVTASYAEGAKVTLAAATTFTRSGYTFDKWSDGEKTYNAGSSFTMPAKNVTFTAVWKKNTVTVPDKTTYSVSYQRGASDATGTIPVTASYAEGAKVTLAAATTFTRSGYTFDKWSDGAKTYNAGSSFTMPAKNVTFTAVWKQNAVTQPDPDIPPSDTDYGKFDADDFLKTNGTNVKNQNGDTVYLRGVNAGGLFVTEHWMTGFQSGKTDSDDYKSLTQTFINRFGEEKAQQLWAEYRANWWSDIDFQNCADMGMTVIRLPFTYMNVDFAAVTDYNKAGINYDFTALDEFIGKAAEYGMYTILDLHGAYGSQNGQDHSGECKEPAQVDFYSNEKMQTLTVKLWSALSKHYKDNPAVAGYDILNEPGERKASGVNSTEKRHWDVFDKIYKAIRAEGDNHIIMFESCWEGWNLPKPAQYGWTNCIYSFHHYVGDNPTVEEHIGNWENKLSGISAQNFGLPLQMGEFTAYGSTEKWEKTLKLLNDKNWHWTSWTYKVWGSMAWGIVNITSGGNKVDAANDSYSTIVEKFRKLRTENAKKYTFSDSGKTLESIIKYSLTGLVEPSVQIDKVGLIAEGGKAYAVFSGKCTLNNKDELLSYVIDAEISGRIKLAITVKEYDSALGTFELKADISGLAEGRNYLHAGFESNPANLPASSAKIDDANSTVSVGGKTYSLGEEWGCRQIVIKA